MSGGAVRAGGTIRVARFVKLSTTANFTVLEADANERIYGIATISSREAPVPAYTTDPPEAAVNGDSVRVHTLGEFCQLRIGSGGCTAGGLLKSDADGNGVAISEAAGTKQEVGARALETASEGELCRVQVCPMTVTTET